MVREIAQGALEESLHRRFVNDLGQLGIGPALGGPVKIGHILKEDGTGREPEGDPAGLRCNAALEVKADPGEDQDDQQGEEDAFHGFEVYGTGAGGGEGDFSIGPAFAGLFAEIEGPWTVIGAGLPKWIRIVSF